MRVSRRLAAYSKPIGLFLIIALLYHLSTDSDSPKVHFLILEKLYTKFFQPKSSKVKSKKHKSSEKTSYEIGEQSEDFPGFSGTIIGRGVDFDVPLPTFRQVGSELGNYEKSLDQIMEGATGTGDFGKSPVTSSDTEAIKRSIKGKIILIDF